MFFFFFYRPRLFIAIISALRQSTLWRLDTVWSQRKRFDKTAAIRFGLRVDPTLIHKQNWGSRDFSLPRVDKLLHFSLPPLSLYYFSDLWPFTNASFALAYSFPPSLYLFPIFFLYFFLKFQLRHLSSPFPFSRSKGFRRCRLISLKCWRFS